MLEKTIAFHCGPALTGIKPSNLISCSKYKYPYLKEEIANLNEQMNVCGISFKILYECNERILLLVYREKNLKEYLQKKEIKRFLMKEDYPKDFNLDIYFSILSSKIGKGKDFPHEIGAFLGYPIGDIYGFIHHKDEGCKYVGYWKVYHNVEKAKKLFSLYDDCRDSILEAIGRGRTLSELFV